MNTGKAQTLIVTTMAGAGVLAFVSAARDGHRPQLRQVLGIAIAGVSLSAFAQVQPELAGGIALLWIVSDVYLNAPAVKALGAATRSAAVPMPTKQPAPRTLSV